MLDLITKSKIRQEIILLFIYNPGRAYYINEIARFVHTSAGNVQRELEKLAGAGLLKKEKKGNALYFSINVAYSLLSDVKNIVDKTIGLKCILRKGLQRARGVDFVFLFGSYVKGEFRSDSDIDLYVIGEISDKGLYEKLREAEMRIHREINYHLATREEFKKNLKNSFFHREILGNFTLIIGDENEFRKLIKPIA